MGREVRRVPLDFDWPQNKVWEGFLTPDRLHEDRCPDCTHGYTAAAEWLQVLASRMDMLGSDIADQKRGRPLHPWLAQDSYPPNDAQYQVVRPSEDILELLAGLAGESKDRFLNPLRGGDGYRIARKIVEAAGLDPKTWGVCPACKGHGSIERYEGQRAEAEAWEPSDPPEGEGWQLWETVSEGSPISPVFGSADGLAGWMSDPARGDRWVPGDVARKFIEEGWAPTGVMSSSQGLQSGVEAIGWNDKV
ncbi:hypothetical protein [Streptomyces sp. CFMR 7]|uniref:hypothetical protein n=1 Tax=Streptomyces sp. CFMR 7 TaxID=1649184 RepID=UPI0011A95E5E|nr:hypothetical protein [Streptomyces sp. CFMR 7]